MKFKKYNVIQKRQKLKNIYNLKKKQMFYLDWK